MLFFTGHFVHPINRDPSKSVQLVIILLLDELTA
jgi:hypothetical protein